MKLKLEKLPSGRIKIECLPDPTRSPIAVELTAEMTETLLVMLKAAQRADRFKFELELQS